MPDDVAIQAVLAAIDGLRSDVSDVRKGVGEVHRRCDVVVENVDHLSRSVGRSADAITHLLSSGERAERERAELVARVGRLEAPVNFVRAFIIVSGSIVAGVGVLTGAILGAIKVAGHIWPSGGSA